MFRKMKNSFMKSLPVLVGIFYSQNNTIFPKISHTISKGTKEEILWKTTKMDIRAGYSRNYRAEAVVFQAIPSDVLMGLPGMVMDRLLPGVLRKRVDILEIRI